MSDLKQQTKVINKTTPVRFSYCNVFVAKAMEEGQEAKFSVQIRIPKTDTALVKQYNDAIDAAKELGKLEKWKGKIPAGLKGGLRDGDVEFPGDAGYAGMWFINANNKNKPGILSNECDEFGKRLPITDPVDFYSGVWGHVSVNFFPYSNKSNGVACSLGNLLKGKAPKGYDDSRLSGGATAEEDFADFGSGDDDFMA